MSKFTVIALATALMFAELTLAEEPTTEMAFRNFAAVGDTESVRELLASGVDVDAQNGFGKTALMLAVETNSMETVVMLLARGADVNKRTVSVRFRRPAMENIGPRECQRGQMPSRHFPSLALSWAREGKWRDGMDMARYA